MNVPVHGRPPDLVGHVLEGVRMQGFVHRGVPDPGACVIYLKAAGAWYRLALDYGTVHWHREEKEPVTWCSPEDGFEYPVRELPEASEFIGVPIASVVASGGNNAVSVALLLKNGRKLVFTGSGDENAVHAA